LWFGIITDTQLLSIQLGIHRGLELSQIYSITVNLTWHTLDLILQKVKLWFENATDTHLLSIIQLDRRASMGFEIATDTHAVTSN
jgi:hypothetical protein